MKLTNIITEAGERPQKTKTRATQDWNSLFNNTPKNLPAAQPKQSALQQPDEEVPPADTKPMKTVSGERTRERMRTVTGGENRGRIIDTLMNMDMSGEDEISDAQARTNAGLDDRRENQLIVPTNAMSTVSNAVVKAEGIVPEWHEVKHLPGYLQQGIRSVGRAVFRAFTTTPIEEIQVLANIGDGPNDQEELDAVLQYLKDAGHRDSEAELEFHERIPNYGAKVKIYKALNYTFMVVKDFAGNYIYAWPSADGDGLADKTPQQPRLK